MSERASVSVVVPARNEEATVGEVVRRSLAAIDALGRCGEVLVVNDGSTDGTARVLDDLKHELSHTLAHGRGGAQSGIDDGIGSGERLRVFTQRRSRGMTSALQTMFRAARGDIVVLIPADMESDPTLDLPALIEHMEAHDLDAVAGWRQGRRDSKVAASAVYNWTMRRIGGLDLHDGNWIKAMRREVVDSLPPLRSDWHRFLLMIAAQRGFRIGEVKTAYQPRPAGRSNFGIGRIPISLLDVLVLKFLLTFSNAPMRFFGGLGLAGAGISLSTLLSLTLYFILTGTQRRPIFNAASTLLVISVLLILVGFLAELIVSQGERIAALEREIMNDEEE